MQQVSSTPNPERDPELWDLAKKRAGFRRHLTTYLIMVPFFWLIWWFTGSGRSENGLPWAVWPTLGWGIGVFFHYMGAYVTDKGNAVQREYDKLKRDRN